MPLLFNAASGCLWPVGKSHNINSVLKKNQDTKLYTESAVPCSVKIAIYCYPYMYTDPYISTYSPKQKEETDTR